MKIKNRLTIYFTLIVGTLLLLFSGAIYLLSANYLEQAFINKFKERVELTSNLLLKNGIYDSSIIQAIDKQTLNNILGEKFLIINDSAKIIYDSFEDSLHPISTLFMHDVLNKKEALKDNGNEIWFGKQISSGSETLSIVAEGQKDFFGELNKLKYLLITGLLLSLVIIFIAGRFFAGNALKPMSLVISEVDNITEKNLHRPINEGNGTDEIAHLAKTFNRLLARLETAFELQRNFVSNASHELRTPLSTITAQLEVTLLNKRTADEYQLVLNSVLDDIRDLNKLSEALFDLTLASRDLSLMKFGNVRVDELLLQARAELLKRKTEYKINMRFGELPDDENQLSVLGKEYLLKSAFINLMDNACKFSENKTVDVKCEVRPGKINIKFSDNGIGMPASYLINLFTPLLRGENAKRIPGHGLGLALCKKIVELHRGEILVSSVENQGTSVALSLPSGLPC